MLKFTKIFQQKQKQKEREREEEINKIVQEASDVEKEYSLEFSIKNLSEKKELTLQERKILDAMVDMYQEKKNDLNPYLPTSSSQSQTAEQEKKEIPEQRQAATQENRQEVVDINNGDINKARDKLKSVKNLVTSIPQATEQKKEEIPKQRQIATQENHLFTLNKEDLDKNRLKSVNVKPVTLNNEETPSELEQIFAKRKKNLKEKKNNTTEKDEVISSTTNVSPDAQNKLPERTAAEDSFLLQQIKAARDRLINNQTTEPKDNLSAWVKSEFFDSVEQKKLEEKKEKDFFNFSETICNRGDLSKEEIQELVNFREQVYNVKLRLGNEAYKRHLKITVSEIVEETTRPDSIVAKEIARPDSIFDDEFNNNMKIINEFLKENYTQEQPKNSLRL